MTNENGRRLLTQLLDDWRVGEYSGCVTPKQRVAIDEAEAILASDGADVANVRESIGARLDRAADHNSNYPGVVRVLRMLAKRVRDGRENADL